MPWFPYVHIISLFLISPTLNIQLKGQGWYEARAAVQGRVVETHPSGGESGLGRSALLLDATEAEMALSAS